MAFATACNHAVTGSTGGGVVAFGVTVTGMRTVVPDSLAVITMVPAPEAVDGIVNVTVAAPPLTAVTVPLPVPPTPAPAPLPAPAPAPVPVPEAEAGTNVVVTCVFTGLPSEVRSSFD